MKVIKTAQLYIKTPDKPGEMAKMVALIAKANVDIVACAGYSRDRQGRVMMVTDNNAKAGALIKKAGYEVRKDPVVLVTGSNAVGQGAKLLKKIAAAKINLSGVYAAGAGAKYVMVFMAANVGKLAAALKK